MQISFKLRFIIILLMLAIGFPTGIFAQTAPSSNPAQTQLDLEAELKDIEKQIADYSKKLSQTQGQKTTLLNKIKQLRIQQDALNLQIKETSLKITKLSGQINTVEKNIKVLVSKQDRIKKDLTVTLLEMNSFDGNIILALFNAGGLAGAFDEIQNYVKLTVALKDLQDQGKKVKSSLTIQQTDLLGKKDDANNLLKIKSIQEQSLLGTLGDKNQLLVQTKGQESSYQSILADKKKRAAEIRNRIYELFNVGKQINFGQAVDIAKWASGYTGVRPALLLAILTQESNLGKNVGTCNRAGDPASKSWKVIMKPSRDQTPFKKITGDLGLDIDTTPVSCPMRDKNGGQIGWGGAMGPAQFIPSTWMGYVGKITALTGKSTPNPWDIRDAFLASAIKLKADGANGTYNGDWAAAMRYFSGSTNTKYRFYGDNVMATAKKYEADIDELK